MTRKRDTPPEALLQRVIRDLEQSNRVNHPSHHRAVLALLAEGPLMCSDAVLREITQPHPERSLWRAELIAFLRTLVREEGRVSYGRLTTSSGLTFSAHLADGRVTLLTDSRDMRDVVVLQLMLLLHAVGLRNVRICGAAEPGGCQHLFVKTYRREFCSARCQQRDYKRRLRQRQREQKEQQTRTRRRRITKGQR
jgi:hypothetical protein